MTTLEAQHEVITNLILENKKLKQERDEAIKRYEEISRVFEGANEEEWKPCTTLGETVARILKERDEARQPNKELHSTDPMWQKPLSTSNPIPYTTNP